MAKNGAGFDPDIEDVNISDEDDIVCEHTDINFHEDDRKTTCLDCGEVL